jgi:hypothetical protein
MPRRINLHSNNVRCEQVKRSNSQKLSGFGTVTPTLAELQADLDSVRRGVRNLTVLGMDPKQTPELSAHQRPRAVSAGRNATAHDGARIR